MPGDDSGAFHSAELWYVFGSLNYCWRPLEPADHDLSERMMAYWSSFMKNGDPDPDGGDGWLPCTEEQPYYQILDIS